MITELASAKGCFKQLDIHKGELAVIVGYLGSLGK